MILLSTSSRLAASICCLCLGVHVWADTVTTNTPEQVSCNGTVTALDDKELRITARFVGNTSEFKIPRERVALIEFNDSTLNSKAPKGPFLAREATGNTPSAPHSETQNGSSTKTTPDADIVFLKGGGTKNGRVLGVNEKEIHLEGSPPIPRRLVHSIQFAQK